MTKIELQAIGERIRQKRDEMKLTQQIIYETLDISQNHYSRIENGHVGMSFDILLQLCDILQVSTDYILTGKLSNPSRCAFLEQYNQLTEKQKQYIDKHMRLFSEFNFK